MCENKNTRVVDLSAIDPNGMSTLEKLSIARDEIAKLDLKMSGYNAYKEYKYYELGDFMPVTLNIFRQLKLIGLIDFGTEGDKPVISIVNIEDPESNVIKFTTKDSRADIQGAQSIQNMGGEIKFQRRYLWIQAIELSESDDVNQAEPVPTERQKYGDGGSAGSDSNNGDGKYIDYEIFKQVYKSKDPEFLEKILRGEHGVLSQNKRDTTQKKLDALNEEIAKAGGSAGTGDGKADAIPFEKFKNILTKGTLAEVIEAFNSCKNADQKKSLSMRVTALKRGEEEPAKTAESKTDDGPAKEKEQIFETPEQLEAKKKKAEEAKAEGSSSDPEDDLPF